MASLKCTTIWKNCQDGNIFHANTRLLNDQGVFVGMIEEQWVCVPRFKIVY